jgi:glycine dehydrogenase
MVAIRAEIERVAAGQWTREDNPLRNAPHTAAMVVSEGWDHAYGREVAAFPSATSTANKYWPPVRRIDQGYGDRNLMCSCPPLSAYAEQ